MQTILYETHSKIYHKNCINAIIKGYTYIHTYTSIPVNIVMYNTYVFDTYSLDKQFAYDKYNNVYNGYLVH